MPNEIELLKHLYERFNARDIEKVLAAMMHEDAVWANGMEADMSMGGTAFAATGRASGP
jgi:hypothetical protein